MWKYEQRAGVLSLVATAGGLVLGGDANGRFRALDSRSGKVLWETNLGSPVSGYPITFAVDGKQYVAVATGPSGEAIVHAAPHAGAEAERDDAGRRLRAAVGGLCSTCGGASRSVRMDCPYCSRRACG